MKSKIKKKDLIYQYLINGEIASDIKNFKDITCTKGYISQVVKEFLEKDYIRLIDRYPKRYMKSLVSYPIKFSELTSSMIKPMDQPRIHLNILKYEILDPIKIPPIEKPKEGITIKQWMGKNNTSFLQISRIVDVGQIHYRICNNKTLLLFTPGFYYEPKGFRHYRMILLQKAQELINWFTKSYGCTLGDVEITRPSDIAINEKDPYLQEMCNKYGLIKLVDHNGEVIDWWDSSKGYFEFETRKENIAEIKAFMPVIVENLQDRLFTMQNEIAAHDMVITGFNAKIEQIQQLLNELSNLVNKTKPGPDTNLKEDTFLDVT